MAKHKIDELFSKGLEEIESKPSANAWSQIEGDLSKSNKPVWSWLSVAASAALVIATSWYLLGTSEATTNTSYDYANTSIEALELPAEIVYVPIYIHTVVEQPAKVIIQEVAKPVSEQTNNMAVQEAVEPIILAEHKEISEEQPEIITLEDVPMLTLEDELIASVELPIENEPNQLPPVTIIYKQGEPAKESNFTKALNYMEDVRLGEKKLVNFDKLRENFRSKFRSEEEVDTK